MVYKFTSIKQVISKVLADLDIDEESFRIADCIEWGAEAIEKIGSVKQLKRSVSGVNGLVPITITNYQAALPVDLFRLNTVAYSKSISGPWLPMSVATGSFNVWSNDETLDNIVSEFTPGDEALLTLVENLFRKYVDNPVYDWFNKMDRATALELLNTDANLRSILTGLLKISSFNVDEASIGIKYSIKPGYINTNMRDGYVKLSYDAIYVDDDGYPMVPDIISYIEAIYWYITMKLKYPEYLSGRMNREIYYDIRRSWNFYSKQAYGDSLMPNQDEMETIGRAWTKLIPDMNSGADFYENIGEGQLLRNQTK